MKKGSLTIAFYVLLVFVGGVAVGGFGHRLYMVKTVSATTKKKTPEDYRRAYMAEMKERLNLTDTQAKDIEVALDATRDRYRALRERTKPDMDKIQADQTAKIRGILSAEQMKEYDTMRAEREAKRKQGFTGGM